MLLRCAILAVVLLCILSVVGCGKDNSSKPPSIKEDPSFAGDIQPIFTANCALQNCHAAPGQEGMVLSQGVAYSNIVNVNSNEVPSLMRVRPTLPDSSYLVLKTEGRQSVGTQMPPTGPLGSSEIQLIRNWATKGAQDN